MAIIDGTADADVLVGTVGDDVITGGHDGDTMTGGGGNDVFAYLSPGDSVLQDAVADQDLITDFETGHDVIDLSALDVTQVSIGRYNEVSFISADIGPGYVLRINVQGPVTAADIRTTGTVAMLELIGTDGYDHLVGGSRSDVLVGGGGGDNLTGGGYINTFKYLHASDSTPDAYDIITDFSAGSDQIDISALQAANVSLVHSNGATYLFATNLQALGEQGQTLQIAVIGDVWGQDVVTGTNTKFYIVGDDTAGHLVGGVGDNVIVGGAADDIIAANHPGNHVLIGGGGADRVSGSTGTDTFVYRSASESVVGAADTIDFFTSGDDVIDLTQLGLASARITYAGSTLQITDDSGQTAFSITSKSIIRGLDIRGLSGGVHIVGDSFNRSLVGGAGGDVIQGGVSADAITGGHGGDTLTGGSGDDTFVYLSTQDSDAAAPAANQDVITDFQTGHDTISLTSLDVSRISIARTNELSIVSVETTQGSTLQINVKGAVTAADLRTTGTPPIFELAGTGGYDHLVGGAHADFIIGAGGGDSLTGGGQADTFKYLHASDSSASAYDIITDFETGVDKLDLGGLNPTNVSIVHYNGGAFVFGVSNGETFQIGSVQDINAPDLLGLTSGAFLVAQDGGDTVIGGAFAESVVGGSGDDIIIGGGAADALYGGAGADTFRYLTASDTYTSTPDIIQDFQTGVDKLDLSAMRPTNVSIVHYNGGAIVFGVSGPNYFQINSAQDINAPDLVGLTSAAFLVGDNGGDTIIGSAFNERIVGGTGADIIIGGGGGDTMEGGAGADIFRFLAKSDSPLTGGDSIWNFQAGVDKIDLTAVHTGPQDVFGLAFDGPTTYLFVDLGGDGFNDMRIGVTGDTVHTSDILW